MDQATYQYLQLHPKLAEFVRYNPVWYRYLTRDPKRVYELDKEAKIFYEETLSQRLEKVNKQVQMMKMLIQFAGAMKD